MQRITIDLADDGRITVTAEENGEPAGEPYECDSVEECLQFVGSMLGEEGGEEPAEQADEGEEDYGAMWDEEAGKRPTNPNLMR